jgi:phage gp45-like
MTEASARGKVTAARLKGGRVLVDVAMLHGQQRSRVELLLPAGLTFIPPAGTDVLVLQVGNNPDHRVAVVSDSPAQRVTGLQPGEIGLRDANGQQVVLGANGVVISGATQVALTCSGNVNLTVSGTVTVAASMIKLGSGATKAIRLADNTVTTKVVAE